MTADSHDGFAYEPALDHASPAARRHYWAVAIGLQAVDGLETSHYLRELADGYVRGTYSLSQTGDLIRGYHGVSPMFDGASRIGAHTAELLEDRESKGDASDRDAYAESREADLVSQRIAELLAAAPFYLAPGILADIHRYLFQDLDPRVYQPGEYKTERMVKREEILNGDSVLYADPLAYESSLRMAFSAEAAKSYGAMLDDADLEGFCHTIAFLWQVHPFAEGNTRTVAVFSELYLNHLGFAVTNEPFEHHARYYRDALVRAMYRNALAGIMPDASFLVEFYDNVVNDAGHSLDRERLICSELFDRPELLRNVSPDEALHRDPQVQPPTSERSEHPQ